MENTYNNKLVLITGGAGFIGSNLAQALVPLGADVTVLDAMLPAYGGNLFNFDGISDKVNFVQGDIRDAAQVKSVVAGQDIIFDLAAQVSYIDSKDDPFLDLEMNGAGRLTLLEAVRELAPEARVVFSSSRLVYGKILTLPVREDHPTDPLSIYGIHKLLGEKYYRYYADTYGLKTMSMRIPNPYGPRQQMKHSKYSIVGWFIRQAIEGKAITVYGDGKQERDYLYIDDIVDAFLRLVLKGEAGEVYNIGTHERVQFVDMVDAVVSEVGSGTKEHVPWPKDYEKNETGDYVADTARLQQLTGWQAKVNINEGVKRTVEYYQENKRHYW